MTCAATGRAATRRDEATATKTMAATTMAAMAKAADHSTAVIGRAEPVGGERVFLPLGIEGRLAAGWRGKDPTQILPPQPQLVPLNEVLPYTGIPLITSDPPPWDATAVDRNPP